jgi:hypothetical protein
MTALRKWWALSVRGKPFSCIYKANGRPMNLTWEWIRQNVLGLPRRSRHFHLHVPPGRFGMSGGPMGG